MEKEKTTLQKINGDYDNNCLEVLIGDELIWFKEINAKGEVVENMLVQEVDGGQRGVDVFKNEHFDQFELAENKLHLYQDEKIVKRYTRDDRGIFRRADENDDIIYPKTVEEYQPVVQNAIENTKSSGRNKGMVLQSRERI